MYIGSKILYMKNKMYDILASKKKRTRHPTKCYISSFFLYHKDISSKSFNYFHVYCILYRKAKGDTY